MDTIVKSGGLEENGEKSRWKIPVGHNIVQFDD